MSVTEPSGELFAELFERFEVPFAELFAELFDSPTGQTITPCQRHVTPRTIRRSIRRQAFKPSSLQTFKPQAGRLRPNPIAAFATACVRCEGVRTAPIAAFATARARRDWIGPLRGVRGGRRGDA